MGVMLALILSLVGFAFLDALNVLNLGVTTAVVYDSRLSRRSPLPAGASFITGVFTAAVTFGLLTVLGLNLLSNRAEVEVTPAVRFWVQLVLGVLLIAVAAFSGRSSGITPPDWALAAARRNPWLFGVVGLVIGFGQAPTSVPYLSALALVSAHSPPGWPVLIVAYCVATLLPSILVLALSMVRTIRARRIQRRIVRALTRFGPPVVRIMFGVLGTVLVVSALLHVGEL
jgi:hypothetical protein